jgi:hypothetical protein
MRREPAAMGGRAPALAVAAVREETGESVCMRGKWEKREGRLGGRWKFSNLQGEALLFIEEILGLGF